MNITDNHHLKIDSEGIRYTDMFPPEKDKDGKVKSLEQVTLEFLQGSYVDIDFELVKSFKLIEETEYQDKTFSTVTGAVRYEHFGEPTLKTGSNNKMSKMWDIIECEPITNCGNVKYVRFYSYVNRYFAKLYEAFFVKFVEPNRTLYVYTDHTDLVQTQIGGDTKKDLLKEVISTICLKEEHSLSNVN